MIQFPIHSHPFLPFSSPTAPFLLEHNFIRFRQWVINLAAMLTVLRTACLHVFLATQWHRLRGYYFKKSLMQTSTCCRHWEIFHRTALSPSEYEHTEGCTGMTQAQYNHKL